MFFLISGLYSCEKEIQLDFPEFTPKLVVNSIFEADVPWNVFVTKSRNIFEIIDDSPLIDAQVKITDLSLNEFYFLSHSQDGIYTHPDYNPVEGNVYFIEVAHPEHMTVTARAKIPKAINVEIVSKEIVEFEGKQAIKLEFDIKDDPDDDNYFIYEIVNLFKSKTQDFTGQNFVESPIKIWLSTLDGNTGYITDGTKKQSKLFVTDKKFRGSILNTSLVSYIEFDEAVGLDGKEISNDDYILDFSNTKLKVVAASKDLYEYYKTVELVIQQKTLNSSISTPIKPYTNITNGLGIFAGFSSTIITLQ